MPKKASFMDGEFKFFLIGLGLVVCLFALVYVATRTNHADASPDDMRLYANFSRIDGIQMGASVTIAGVKVGVVDAIDFDYEHNKSRLTLRFFEPLEIPYDSSLKIVSDGLFGAKFIAIAPGGDFDSLLSGDEFEYVQNAVMLEEVLEDIVNRAEQKKINIQ